MATAEQLAAWRDRLQEARFQGVRSVRDADGSEVSYRSDAELRNALAAVDRELARLENAAHPRVTQLQLSKGL